MALAVAALIITGGWIGSTVNISVRLPVPNALLAERVIVLMPIAVGVPEITPVIELRLKPAGRPITPNLVGALFAVMV